MTLFKQLDSFFDVAGVDDNVLTRGILVDGIREAADREHDFGWGDVIDVLREWELHTPPQLYDVADGVDMWRNFDLAFIDYMEACGDEVSYDLLRGEEEAIYNMTLGIYQMLCGDLADNLEFIGADEAI
jgi:hypothetical protein